MRAIIEENWESTYHQIQEQLKIGASSVHTIIHEKLHMHWVCRRFVPHFLTPEQKQRRIEICKENLKMFKDGGNQIINKIITGGETYVHYYNAPTHREAKLWVYEGEIPPAKVRSERSAKKICYAIFFMNTGLVKALRLQGQKTVTAKWYTDVCFDKVFKEVINAHPSSGLRGIILHHDNARPHTAQLTTDYLKKKKIKIMPQPP